ncbi:type II secretion system F family protein [bacterium]|nr:type II secretion system F family protein [bacterium]
MFLFKTIFSKKSQFYFRLSSLLSSGYNVLVAISHIEENTSDPVIKNISHHLKKEVSERRSFSEAMEKLKDFFSPFEIKTVSAGIKSGNFAEIVSSLSAYFDFFENIRKKLLNGLTYPFILLNLAIIIPAFPVLFLKGFFPFLGKIIPPFILIYGIIFVFIFLPEILKNQPMRKTTDEIIVKIPLIGKIIINFQMILFLKTFSLLYKSGIDIIDSFKTATEVVSNETIRMDFEKNFSLLKENRTISEAIRNNLFLPNQVKEIIETGQISGNMDIAIDKVVEYTEEETNYIINQSLKIFPVFVYLLIATYVAYIIISFYSNYIKTINSLL